jgi:DNA-binding transcriptional regulator YiaG
MTTQRQPATSTPRNDNTNGATMPTGTEPTTKRTHPGYAQRPEPAAWKALAARRARVGLSQPDLADLLHVHRNSVGYWERGMHRSPVEVLADAERIIAELERAQLAQLLALHPTQGAQQ